MKHSHADIEQLLGRFMDGMTTIEEERLLADYFRTADVPEEWEDYRRMFAFIEAGCPEDNSQFTIHNSQSGWRVTFKRYAAVAVAAAIAGIVFVTAPPYIYNKGEEPKEVAMANENPAPPVSAEPAAPIAAAPASPQKSPKPSQALLKSPKPSYKLSAPEQEPAPEQAPTPAAATRALLAMANVSEIKPGRTPSAPALISRLRNLSPSPKADDEVVEGISPDDLIDLQLLILSTRASHLEDACQAIYNTQEEMAKPVQVTKYF